ncbi:MAG: imidazole glycerol phosphate synthase subunit HisH [Chromatiales bacterium]|nr:imidazole glycerol phosphate synthase subunit HisH [Chromatiales bacterium]
MTSIAIIDYGMGNLHSISKALEHAAPDARVEVTADHGRIRDADRVVFPGVGAIRDCMAELKRYDLVETIRSAASEKPFLGICLGMQALLDHSEENGGIPCLGIIEGEVRYFGERPRDPTSGEILKVPHMGWNQVRHRREHPLWQGIPDNDRFYFVHSYYVEPANPDDTVGAAEYSREFAAAVARDSLFAVQFHPEKSQHAGLRLLANFAAWDGQP